MRVAYGSWKSNTGHQIWRQAIVFIHTGILLALDVALSQVSYSPGWPQTYYVDKIGPELSVMITTAYHHASLQHLFLKITCVCLYVWSANTIAYRVWFSGISLVASTSNS